MGIQPDVLVCRCDVPITDDVHKKIALFCNVEPDCVIQNTTAETLYEVPLLMAKEGLDEVVCRKLGLDHPPAGSAGVERHGPAGEERPSERCASPWWASTPSSTTPTSLWWNPSTMPARPTTLWWTSSGWTPRC